MAEHVRRRLVISVVAALWILAGALATSHSPKQYISAGQADRVKPSARSNGVGTKHTKSLNPIQALKPLVQKECPQYLFGESKEIRSNMRSDSKSNSRKGIGPERSILGGIGIGVVAFAAVVGSTYVPAANAMDESRMETSRDNYGRQMVQQTSDAVSSAEKALRSLRAVNESKAIEDARIEDARKPPNRFETFLNDQRNRNGQNRLPWERNNGPLATLTGQNRRLPWEKDNNPLSRLTTALATPPRGLPWESYESPLAALFDIKKENPLTTMSENLSEGRLPWQDRYSFDNLPWVEDENPLDALFENNRLPWEKSPLEEVREWAKETVVPFAAVGGGIAALHAKKTEKKGKSADPPSS